jgi:queuine tRNA-ribosyltransferase subunit QTRTD1
LPHSLPADPALHNPKNKNSLEQPSPAQLRASGGRLREYIGAAGWPLLAANRDPTLHEYGVGKPSTNAAVYAVIHSGGQLVTPERYMAVIRAAQPDIFVGLADEVPGDAGRKRAALSVDRTLRWTDECARLLAALWPGGGGGGGGDNNATHEQQQQQQQEGQGGQAAGSQPPTSAAGEPPAKKRQRTGDAGGGDGERDGDDEDAPPLMFAPVMGASFVEERARSAEAVADQPGAAGFALCGFGMGEDAALRPALLAAAVDQLPADKPRLLLGMGGPYEVLEAVRAGADVFDCGYPTHATASGHALSFPTRYAPGGNGGSDVERAEAAGADAAAAAAAPDEGSDETKLNLWALQHRRDRRPLVEGCACFACRRHTRAYVHHLLHSNEMLGSVLLEAHNTHHWLAFFEGLRESVAAGRLNEHAEWLHARRRAARACAE